MPSNTSKIVLTVIVAAIVVGGGVYFWQNSSTQEVTPISKQTTPQNQPSTYLENGVVYYVGNNGEKRAIAQSNTEYPGDYVLYKKAELSPNKKFILLGSYVSCPGNECGGSNIIEIYDITLGKKYEANEMGGENFAEWLLNENKLRIVGECGMGISCGIFVSKDRDIPWILEKAEYP